jgi:hypothetical protein
LLQPRAGFTQSSKTDTQTMSKMGFVNFKSVAPRLHVNPVTLNGLSKKTQNLPIYKEAINKKTTKAVLENT